jgi:hypothetical protein
LKKSLSCFAVIVAIALFESCGGSSKAATTSGFTYRAFVSNPLYAGSEPAIQIVNAQTDLLAPTVINLAGQLTQPSMMTLSPSKRYTMVYSPSGPAVSLIDNNSEGLAQNSSGASTTAITLPGPSESMFIAADNATGYAAIPTVTPQNAQTPGAVVQMNLPGSFISATIAIPGAHYIVPSNSTNLVLVFSDNSNDITLISPILVGTGQNSLTVVQSPNLDHPVGAIFSSDDSVAYILNCGPECGGTQASVSVLDLTSDTVGAPVPLPAATNGLLNGTTLYVAGSAPDATCGSNTSAKHCGDLSIIDTGSMTVTKAAITITDGWHNHMELSGDGQLFIGSRSCSNVNISGGEVRGCLSIYNSTAATVIIPPFVGDVTGIAPIPGRTIVYVVQNASLNIFDTRSDTIEVQNPGPLDIVGQPFDVKYVDSGIPN